MEMTTRAKRITVYVLYCVVVLALIGALALIYRPHNARPVAVTHRSNSAATHKPVGVIAGKGGSTHITTSPKSTTKSSSGANQTATPAETTAPLSNTGPGNVIGLFAAVSVLGAWLWRRKLIRSVIR